MARIAVVGAILAAALAWGGASPPAAPAAGSAGAECSAPGACAVWEADGAALLQHAGRSRRAPLSVPGPVEPPDVARHEFQAVELHGEAPDDAADPEDHPCDLQAEGGCPIADMEQGKETYVRPGGKTICINTSTPYVFRVIRGDPKKLLFFFQGGGACFDRNTTIIDPTCYTKIEPASPYGVFNWSAPGNPYAGWTSVTVMYCSGDAHAGNITHVYEDDDGRNVTVKQHGYWNAKSALDWALAEMPSLTYLVVSGCSAGSLGTQVWARTVMNSFAGRVSESMAAIADSFVAIIPPQIPPGSLLIAYGACTVPLWTESFLSACLQGKATPEMAYGDAMVEHPNSAFSNVNSKADALQIRYYNLFASVYGLPDIDADGMAKAISLMLGNLSKEHKNYVSYIADGDQHCFLNRPCFETTDTRGEDGLLLPPVKTCPASGPESHVDCPVSGTDCSGGQCCPRTPGLVGDRTFPCPSAPAIFNGCEYHTKVTDCAVQPTSLVSWVNGFPVCHGDRVASECYGPVLTEPEFQGSDYCYAGSAGKVFAASD